MKKLITLLLILALALPALALADLPDLSGLSYDELVELKDKINLAMWKSQEWQEVTIPVGVWEIGKDIPEGHWSIRCGCEDEMSFIVYTDRLDEYGKNITYGWKGVHVTICNKKHKDGSLRMPEYPEETDIEMKSGMYLIVDAPLIFTPYTGKPSLGFK